MKTESFYIDTIIERICATLAMDIADTQLHLHTSLVPVEVVGNELRIEQVIVNFLTNYLKL